MHSFCPTLSLAQEQLRLLYLFTYHAEIGAPMEHGAGRPTEPLFKSACEAIDDFRINALQQHA